jgi:hypothetical protein
MDQELKLQDVASRARLSLRTARYVLSHSGLPGLPDGGGRGCHRVFDIDQAMRLALATQLLMTGVRLDAAAEATQLIERTVQARTRSDRLKESLYGSSVADPWQAYILDARYVRVWRNRGHDLFDNDEFYSIAQAKRVSLVEINTPITEAQINLTLMETLLIGRPYLPHAAGRTNRS